MIRKERVYHSQPVKGEYRVLVDRLWPRGVSKEELRLDAWMKDLGPSTVLRRWFNHDPERFEDFKVRYLEELKSKDKQALLQSLLSTAKQQDIVLLYASREEHYNQVTILLEVLASMGSND